MIALLAEAVAEYSPSLIVLGGIHAHPERCISSQRFAGRILNIHPSLLPKYPGLHTHRRVLEAREAEHGVTVHFVTEQLDGGPPVHSSACAISTGRYAIDVGQRVLTQEHRIYPLAVRWFCRDDCACEAGQARLDGRRCASRCNIGDLEPEKPS